MFNNSFNRLSNCKKNCSSNESALKNDESLDDSDDWESKYDVSISVLKEEYLQCISRIRNVDEKANKYLLVISIITTGLFVILSSSAIESLEFNYLNSLVAFQLTIAFMVTLITGIWYGNLILRAILNCFNLVELQKMPDILELLNDAGSDNSAQYKHLLISCYQQSINAMDKTVSAKQEHIKVISKNIKFFIVFLSSSLICLITLKIIGI